MSVIRMQTANVYVLQLLRKNLTAGKDWEEVTSVTIEPKPSDISYTYAGRSSYVQTEPDNGLLDRFGLAPTGVTLQGTFGIQPRRVGLMVQDGYTRFWTFKEEIFKISHQAKKPTKKGETEYLYGLNFYDFSNGEKFAVDIPQFSFRISARYNPRERMYSMQLMRIGDVIHVSNTDPMLTVLLALDSLFNDGANAIDAFAGYITSNPVFQVLEGVVVGYDLLGPTLQSLQTELALYANGANMIASSFLQSGQESASVVQKTAAVFGIKF